MGRVERRGGGLRAGQVEGAFGGDASTRGLLQVAQSLEGGGTRSSHGDVVVESAFSEWCGRWCSRRSLEAGSYERIE